MRVRIPSSRESLGVADHRKILIVGICLGNKELPLLTADRGKVALLYRFGPVTEALQHCVEIKSFCHVATVAPAQGRH